MMDYCSHHEITPAWLRYERAEGARRAAIQQERTTDNSHPHRTPPTSPLSNRFSCSTDPTLLNILYNLGTRTRIMSQAFFILSYFC